MSDRYELVKGYFDSGLWSEAQVRNAALKNWITEDEFENITGKPFR